MQVVIKDQGPPCKIVLGVALKGQGQLMCAVVAGAVGGYSGGTIGGLIGGDMGDLLYKPAGI